MKIDRVVANNHKRVFEVHADGRVLPFPYAWLDREPCAGNPIDRVYVDPELGNEGFTVILADGFEDAVHIDAVLEYNHDPDYMKDLVLYRITLEAQDRVEESGLSKREIARRLGTSASQLYRLLDQTNYAKSIDQVVRLLSVLDCDVDLVVRKHARPNPPVPRRPARAGS